MRQHLTSVEAACTVCSGSAEGASLGSSAIQFTPGPIRGGEYAFSIGTAGSTTLVLQTILPALLNADTPSSILLSGGTHNPYAPSVYFLQRAFTPLLHQMGATVHIDLERHGFYPAGGGRVRVDVEPSKRLKPRELIEAAPVSDRRVIATVAGLTERIAERELAAVRDQLGWPDDCMVAEEVPGHMGPGNVLTIEVTRGAVTEVFTGFGERRVSSECVAEQATAEVAMYLNAGVPIWKHLADQIMLPMAIGAGGSFQTCELTKHAVTNANVIERFLDTRIHRSTDQSARTLVTVIV